MEQNILYIIAAAVVIAIITIVIIAVRKQRENIAKTKTPHRVAAAQDEPTQTPPQRPVETTKPVAAKPESLKVKLAKTKNGFIGKLAEMIHLRGKVDDELLDDMEELMMQADVGVQTSMDIIEKLREDIQAKRISTTDEIQARLQEIIQDMMLQEYSGTQQGFSIAAETTPYVVLFTGVNGVGKTTTIGKLAKRLKDSGKSVMLVAADTFRAAAIEQLGIWADRAGVDIVKHEHGADPSAVVYDGVMAAKSRKYDVVLIDTAGRQHTKVNLMNELGKITRTIKKIIPDAPHETLLVIDATTGQNAVTQAEMFDKAAALTGIVLTKLDGTAKGGIVIGIKHQLQIPVKLIGVGEAQEDLRDFKAEDFVDALFA